MQLGVKRVIKEITKGSIYSDNFYMEINILKNIRHDNIPMIFDVEEYEDNYYIVEEYIEGTSLFDLIELNGSIDESRAVEYGYQITSLIAFLHSNESNPILFLDLQPRNIIVNNDKIYILDFGSSMIKNILERNKVFGTVGFAAPEQYKGEELGTDTDIFGIGALLFYMVTATNPKKGMDILLSNDSISRRFKKIILICLKENRKHRYNDAKVLLQKLCLLKTIDKLQVTNSCSDDESLYVSVVGTETKVGTTYIAFQMAMYLNEIGIDVVYKENNTSGHMKTFMQMHSECMCEGGVFVYENLKIIPHYENCEEFCSTARVVIVDEGVYESGKKYNEMIFLVSGSSEWEIQNTINVLEKQPSILNIIFNKCSITSQKIIETHIRELDNIYFLYSGKGMTDKDNLSFYSEFFQEVIGTHSNHENCGVSVIDKLRKYKETLKSNLNKIHKKNKSIGDRYLKPNKGELLRRNKKGITIGVIGSGKATGCTAVAVSLAMYLRYVLGGKVAIVENNSRKCFRKMAMLEESMNIKCDSHTFKDISFFYNNINTYIQSSKTLLDDGEYNYIINDYGEYTDNAFEEIVKCEYKLLVISMQAWKKHDAEEMLKLIKNKIDKNCLNNMTIVVNGDKRDINYICDYTGVSVKPVPYISDATKLNDEIISFYQGIIK